VKDTTGIVIKRKLSNITSMLRLITGESYCL